MAKSFSYMELEVVLPDGDHPEVTYLVGNQTVDREDYLAIVATWQLQRLGELVKNS